MTPDNGNIDSINNTYHILLTNARSLSPKIESLQNYFEAHDLHVAMVSESWLRDGKTLNKDVIDLEYGSDLKIIYRNRPAKTVGARQVGGGVSIIYSKSRCSLKERKIVGNNFELVAAVGKIGKVKRQTAFFCLYIEPRIKVADMRRLNDLLASEILKLKAKGDPLIFIGGDLNRRSLADAIQDFPDISQVNFDPTRQGVCLDVMLSNATNVTSTVWPPLTSMEGVPSDHDCVVFSGEEQTVKDYTWVRKSVRKHTRQAVVAFGRELDAMDWDDLMPDDCTQDELVDRFQAKMSEMTDRLFPMQTVKHRSNEKPWVTQAIRRLAKQKKRVFKRENKSHLWMQLRDRLLLKVRESQHEYINRTTSQGTSTKAYFTAVKAIWGGKQADNWSLTSLFPDKSDEEAGNEAAAYFTRISNEFPPLPDRPPPADVVRPPMTLEEVRQVLKRAKKPSSSVPGDVLPRLMKKYHHWFAVPTRKIFNAVFRSNCWPRAWKVETTVVIPKVAAPSSLSECRNISCTNFLSKVLESVLLQDLRREIPDDPHQYGGLKGCSVDHLLVDMTDTMLGAVDRGETATVLSIDFEKAFNRLNHHECLKQLERLGASAASLALVGSFLTGRSMRVKLNGKLSDAKQLSGGSPQGSILGSYLYCSTTQQLNADLERRPNNETPGIEPGATPMNQTPSSDDEDPGMGILRAMDISPSTEPGGDGDRVPDLFLHQPTPDEELAATAHDILEMFKYIDDTSLVECTAGECIRHITGAAPTEVVNVGEIHSLFEAIIRHAEGIGMRVNCLKTQMLCMAPDNGYNTLANLNIGGVQIPSNPTMKLLGFNLSSAPGVAHHVAAIKEKFRKRFWTLIHLKRAGLTGTQLFKIYATLVRPVLEVNSVVFHSMLNKGQVAEIERMQKQVVRLCFGFTCPYAEAIRIHDLRTLEARRVTAIQRFVSKTINGPSNRFSDKWFRPRPTVDTNIRRRRPYVERKARTERYRTSPLLYFQRVANDLATSG